MRSIKSILIAAGNAKIKNPEIEEARLILTSINDVFMPLLYIHDIPTYEGIMMDLFHGVKLMGIEVDPLIEAIKVASEARNLQPTDHFIEKALEIYDMVLSRHGVMVIGESFGGKTCSYQAYKL
jgi:dynein heavy chain